ncbi:MAG: oligosaccharide flippase family protein, partial [Gammaproteobacteria bacterium]|nr:oligosaccharide flippase family protein [Gammaproteobacteria bacterium]
MGPFKLQSLSLSNPHIREFVLGSAVGLGIKVLSAVSLFLMNIVVARALGAAEAGLFFLGFALVVVVAAVGRLGLDQAVVRFVAASQATHAIGAIHSIYRKSIVWVGISSAGLALLGYCNVEWLVRNVFDQPGFDPVLRSLLIAIP